MTISYSRSGFGSPVVLLHAGVCDSRMWDEQARVLVEAGYQVIRPDLRGFGETPAPETPYNEADDVMEMLTEAGIDRAAVVGASYGGAVALELASRWPDRVSALVLLSSALDTHEPSPEFEALDLREDELLAAGDIDGAVDLAVDTWLGPDAGAEARDLVRTMQRRAYELQLEAGDVDDIAHDTDLTSIEAPTLVVSGARDLVDFQEIADVLARAVGDAKHVRLDWAGHLPSLERPEVTATLVRGFLDDVRSR